MVKFLIDGDSFDHKRMNDLSNKQWAKIHGNRAGNRGQPHTDNPYEKGSEEHSTWQDAYRKVKSFSTKEEIEKK